MSQTATISLPDTTAVLEADVSLAGMTSYRVGGPAEWFVAPQNLYDLQAALAWAHQEGQPVMMLGAGSNLLISDAGLPGLVISTRYLRSQSYDADQGQLTVAAGKPLPRLCWQLAKKGWSGLEWAVGVPGTIGGAVVMNAGAHGSCIADSLVEVQVLQPDGQIKTLKQADLQYQYRSSILQGSDLVVVEATFQLDPSQTPESVHHLTQVHLDHRLTTQPYDMPSCGSVFRNPLPKTAGWLIEQTGLKGFQIGGAQVAEKHANFIVNRSKATANDVYALIAHVKQQVQAQWGLLLHPEVKILGTFRETHLQP